MKKLVLSLSLVLAFSSATAAFAAIPQNIRIGTDPTYAPFESKNYSISSFIYAIYFLIKTIIYGDQAAGFPTLIVVILFLGGIQLFSLGVIGEYIGRIFKETKRRPAYIASDYNEKKLGYDE